MKKNVKLALILVSSFILTACSGEIQSEVAQTEIRETSQTEITYQPTEVAYQPSTLFFNTLEATDSLRISWDPPNDFFLPITDEQLNEIFPFLELANAEWVRGQAEYQRDGTLVEIWLDMSLPSESIYRFEIRVGFGKPPMSLYKYGPFDDEIFEYSNKHGILVRAIMIDDDWLGDSRSFDATFVIDDVYYRIFFRDEEERGKNRMNEVVNALILTGTEGFVVLENPDIPYMRSEFISFENALIDPDFGAFVPTVIPDELTFHWGNRTIQEHLDENSLSLTWEVYYDEQYLYDIYTQWVSQRTADTPVFPFEDVLWGIDELRWGISKVREGDLEYLTSATVFMQDDSLLDIWWDLIFTSDELTFELIERLERTGNEQSFPQGAYWEEDFDSADVWIPYARRWFRFGVLFDDVLITISAERMTPEVIWSMLEGLLD